MNIFKKILDQSKTSSKKIFLDQKYKYSDLYKLSTEYLSFFNSNLKRGEIICLVLPYSIDFIAIVLSARMNGNILCFLNPDNTDFEKNTILEQANYSMIISNKFFNKKSQKIKNFYFIIKKNKQILKKEDAFIIFTSGTTSSPKGAILTNNSIKNNVLGIIDQLKINSKDRTIIYSPPNYAMGISQVITFLYLRSSFIFDTDGIKFAKDFLNKIKKYKISILNLNIASFKYIKTYIKKFKTPYLKIVMNGGMKMTPKNAEEIFNFFENKYLVNFYGCTENSPRVSHFKFDKKQLKKFKKFELLPVGKAINGTNIFIHGLKKNTLKKYGEIILNGNSLMRGYLIPNRNTKSIKNYKTKDLGFFLNNNLFVIGRLDNVFKSGNEKISPEEIEDKIGFYIKGRIFVVIKREHPILNWQPILVIEGKRLKSDFKLLSKFEKELSNFKLPKEILYIKKFFRNNYGKIDRKKIFNYSLNYAN